MNKEPATFEVEVRMVETPKGTPATLLQLPNGFVLLTEPANIRQLAAALIDASDELEMEKAKRAQEGPPQAPS